MPNDHCRATLVIGRLNRGGAERVLAWLAGVLNERGWSVSLVLLGSADDPMAYALPDAVQIRHADIFWPSSGLGRVADLFRRIGTLRRTILATRPQVVISFIDGINLRVMLALLGSRIPIVVSERIDPRLHPKPRAFRLLRRILYPLASAVVIQTPALRPAWPAWWRNVRVIPNPIRRFDASPLPDVPYRYLLTVARLDPQKGCDLLIRAFLRISADTDVHLVLLGEGPERRRLTELTASLGLEARVHFLGERQEVGAWLQAAILFVLASHYEGQPNALAEAMAMGRPCIATDTPGACSLIQSDRNGRLIPRGDETALANAMRILLDDDKLRLRLGQEAEAITQTYVPERIADQWEALLHALIGKHPANEYTAEEEGQP
ncbi:MAG: glycosyltransferase [Desulfovibrionaceae bacterium]